MCLLKQPQEKQANRHNFEIEQIKKKKEEHVLIYSVFRYLRYFFYCENFWETMNSLCVMGLAKRKLIGSTYILRFLMVVTCCITDTQLANCKEFECVSFLSLIYLTKPEIVMLVRRWQTFIQAHTLSIISSYIE